MTPEEIRARGWDRPDIVFVSGDAYLDHPSFAAALLGRVLERHGFKVAILAQPDWRSADTFRAMGRPRLFYAVSAGNMDSMINHYTANKKRRNDDAYSPGGRVGLRPDRPTNVYAQRCREAFPDVAVVIGGVEASLRRIAHFDYWSETVRPGILLTSKADLLGFGMGEQVILEIARRLDAGESIRDLRDMRGVAYLLGKSDGLPDHRFDVAGTTAGDGATRELPSFEEVKADKRAFAVMTRILHQETNPLNGRRLTQRHGDRLLVVNPPALPLSEREMDRIYDLPYTRRPHHSYAEPIPAHTMIRDSVTIMRGCFGGCTFMYQMRCTKPEVEQICRRLSCIHPTVCKLLGTSHKPTIELMRKARSIDGIKQVHVASGIRMDLARADDEYLEELAEHHTGGHLKVAPEHVSGKVLDCMKKPPNHTFDEFAERFQKASKGVGKEQYLAPYFIASHPGSGVAEMIELAVFLQQRGYKPRQVQDFIPAPMDIATCMYYTGLDPMTMRAVDTVHKLRDRVVQRALMQFFKPENYFVVRKALTDAGRKDLIGKGKRCLIPDRPPKAALEARRRGARPDRAGNHVHTKAGGTKPVR
ncbi:MAG: DUF3362 domain-containing protein [Planctomycetota bacterium]|jgi:radical SAM superfamily enzyme YgiQ (UPF0313 family)